MKHVDTRHKDYQKFAPKWKRVRDVAAGKDAVHAAGEDYLPRLEDQDDKQYKAYVKRAGFYNATWRTMSGLLGMMFRKPVNSQMGAAIASYARDIDMAGTTLETFARKIALEIIGPGRVGILVDHPAVENVTGISLAAAEQQGLRPMLKQYRAETIINWEYRRVRNYWVLAKVVLEEEVEEADGEFKMKTAKQWRVLDLDEAGLYRQRVFRKKDKARDGDEFEEISLVYPLMNGQPMQTVPFFIVGVDGVDCMLDEPPLIDLVDLNLEHYCLRADWKHGMHFSSLPTLMLSGFVNEDGSAPSFRIGSQVAIVAPDPNAKGEYIEFKGHGLNPTRDALNDMKDEMAILGARMLFAEKRAVEAAETASIHREGENSVLAAIATAISEAMEKALNVFSAWAGVSQTVTYQLNRDYNPAMMDAQRITALMKAVQGGLMSEASFWQIMQRADIADSEVTWEEEQERIGQQEPVRPAMPPANDGQEMAA